MVYSKFEAVKEREILLMHVYTTSQIYDLHFASSETGKYLAFVSDTASGNESWYSEATSIRALLI